MAVEIPVVVDIEGAFKDAARRVDSAMKPLKKAVDDDVLKVKFRMTIEGTTPDDLRKKYGNAFKQISYDAENGVAKIERSFGQLFEKGRPNLQELSDALGQFKKRLNDLWEHGYTEPKYIESLQKAIILCEEYVNQRRRAVQLTEEQYRATLRAAREEERRNFIIQSEAKTMAEMAERISALRGKLENIAPGGAEWRQTAREITKATAALAKFEQKYQMITTKPGSINRISAEMSVLEQKWNAMSKRQKFDADGNLKASAQRMIDKYRQLTVESERFGQSLAQAASRGSTELSKTNSHLLTLAKGFASMFALHSVGRFLTNIRDVTAELELQKVALGSILQDTGKANLLFSQIKQAALQSPFEIKQLITFTKQLAAYRIETDKLFDTTKKLADVSAGLGVDMQRLILAYGQVRAASVLRGQELRQFTEAGIPLVDLLAKKFRELQNRMVSTSEVFELISKRAVPFRMIEEIFNDMTSAGGIFYEMQLKQSETLKGQWMKLKDAFTIMYDEMGNLSIINDAMKGSIQLLISLTQSWRTLRSAIYGMAGAYALIKLYKAVTMSMARSRNLLAQATKLSAKAEKDLQIAEATGSSSLKRHAKQTQKIADEYRKAALAGKRFTQINHQLRASFMNLSSWIGIAITAVGTLVTALLSTDDPIKRLNESLAESRATADTEAEAAVRNFERLAKNAVKAVDGSTQQKEALNELKRIYGDMLPSQALQIENLRKLEGGYKSLTDAIKENIRWQAHEKNVQDITATYGSEIGKWEKDLVEYFQDIAKVTKAEARVIVDTLKEEFNKEGGGLFKDFDFTFGRGGMLRAEKNAKIVKDFMSQYNISGDVNKFLGALYKTGFLRFESAAKKIFNATKGLTDSLEEEEKVIKDLTPTLAGYAKIYVDFQKEREKFTSDNTYASDRAKVAHDVKLMQDVLQSAIAEDIEGFDITEYVTDGIIDFDEIKKLFNTRNLEFLEKFVDKIQKDYLGIVPSAKMVAVVREKFEAVSSEVGIGMDDVKRYLKSGEGDMAAYAKKIGDDLKEAKTKLKEYNLAPKKFKTEDIEKQKQIIRFLQQINEWLAVFDKPSKKTKVLKDELKDVQEIYKRYKDLLKYMSKSEAEKNIRDIYGKVTAIDFLSPEDYKKRLSNILKRMKSLSGAGIGGEELAKAILDTERIVQDVDYSELADAIKTVLSNLAAEVKRSKEARDFYSEILSTTGDEDLATNLTVSVYGNIGDDLQKNIKEQLKGTFVVDVTLLPSELSAEDLNEAIKALDWNRLTKYLPFVQKAYRDTAESIVKDAKASTREQIKQWIKELASAKTIAQRRVDISVKTAQRIRDIETSDIPDTEKKSFIADARRKEAEEIAALQYEAFKESPMYVQMFEDLDSASTAMLESMRSEITLLQQSWSQLDPNQLKELQSRVEKIDEVLAERKPISSLTTGFKTLFAAGINGGEKLGQAAMKARKEYNDTADALGDAVAEQERLRDAYKKAVAEHGENSPEAEAAAQTLDDAEDMVNTLKQQAKLLEDIAKNAEAEEKSYSNAAKLVANGVKGLGKWNGYIQNAGQGFIQIASALGASDSSLAEMQQRLQGINNIMTGAGNLASGIGNIVSGKDVFGGISNVIQGIGNLVSGIGDLFSNDESMNRRIEEQERLLKRLEYAYSRLEKAQAKAFGGEYIVDYQKKLQALRAEEQAYLAQAKAENAKDKSRSQERYEEYLQSAVETRDKIKELQSELAEYFSGTDLTSAAQNFADAWIEAYKEFSSTTDAMSEKFNEMIENMVSRSLAAQIMKEQLGPLFKQIQEYSESGDELTAAEIADIAKSAPEYVNRINQAMQVLMQELASVGLNLRDKPGQFTGIARDIAGASEESITGLAAGINTQNFYISHIDQSVTSILTLLGGSANPSGGENAEPEMSPYQTQALQYMSSLPQMRDDMAAIRSLLDKVIKPTGTTSGYRVII